MRIHNTKKAVLSVVLCFSLFLAGILDASAQLSIFSNKNKMYQYSTVAIGVGTSHYFGDLSPYGTFYYGLITNVRWNGTINYTRHFSSRLAARVAFTYARIAGDDNTYSKRDLNRYSGFYLRNLHFRNDIKEFTISGIFNLLATDAKGLKGRNLVMPYAVLGIGFYAHNPKARESATDSAGLYKGLGNWIPLKDLQTSGQGLGAGYPKPYSLVQAVVPVGLGLKIKVNQKFDINLEGGFRLTPFDYLDDVGSAKYLTPADLASLPPQTKEFNNRYNENYSATTGKSRIDDFQNIVQTKFGASPNQTPFFNGTPYSSGMDRGGPRWDSYFLTQITVSYVIGDGVKCPPIR